MTSRRMLKRIRQIEALTHEPVRCAGRFWVEGTLPYWIGGLAVGVIVLRGAVGVLLGMGLAVVVARVLTRKRAPGFPFATIVAVSDGHVHAFKSGFWRNRPTMGLGAWPRTDIDVAVRHKHVTTAATLTLPDGRHIRLESQGPFGRKQARPLVGELCAAQNPAVAGV